MQRILRHVLCKYMVLGAFCNFYRLSSPPLDFGLTEILLWLKYP